MSKFKDINKQIFFMLKVFLALFAVLFINLAYIQIYDANNLLNNPHNTQVLAKAEEIQRGEILASDGKVLAYSEKDNSGFKRIYPEGRVYAPVVGYVSSRLGYSGVESSQNAALSGDNMSMHLFGPIAQLFESDKGYNVKLTLNPIYQEAAYRALGSRKGAVVILNRKTGAVLAMVSNPTFDPNDIDKNWEQISKASDSPLLNRATQGLYPPGSTMKPLIAVEALSQGVINRNTVLNCGKSLYIGPKYSLSNDGGESYGPISLNKAMEVSCNTFFGAVALKMGNNGLEKAFDTAKFNKPIDTDFTSELPHLPNFSKLGDGEIAQVGIGQASLLVTPLRMAMLASGIANGGAMMKPYVVDQVNSANGKNITTTKPVVFAKLASEAYCQDVYEAMSAVVKHGTGTRAAVRGVNIVGKTGTAENPSGADHAWFMGAADLPDNDIAFAIIVENGGFGGSAAAPIIHNIITSILAKEGK